MSFGMNARGTRDEVCASLDALTDAQLGNDGLGHDLRDLFVEYLTAGTDLEDPSDQRYSVNASGHSGRGSVVTLTVTIGLIPFPYQDQAGNPTDTGTGTDTLATPAS
jgi:hypothetical protein